MKLFLVTVLVLAALNFLTIIQGQTNYCSPTLCKNGKKHIACNNNGAFSQKCGSNPRIMTVTTSLINNIVNKHNRFRAQVARGGFSHFSAATRMATMQWSPELAKVASFNVKQCVMKHDACRNTNNFRFAGQNLAMTYWSGKERTVNNIAMSHVNMWFNEFQYTTKAIINKYPQNPPKGHDIGHFTQMMQQKATHIGCAIARWNQGKRTFQLMACNYAYTNIFGKPVYQSGKSGSKCTTGRNPTFPALCSRNEKYNVNSIN